MYDQEEPAEWIVGVDVGGTFTDFAARNTATGELLVHNRPSTPDPSVAIIESFRELTGRTGIAGEQVDRLARAYPTYREN